MTGLEDRQSLSQDIGVAHAAGARLHKACFLSVRVLSRLFRRRFLAELKHAHQDGRLKFFSEHTALADAKAFNDWLAQQRKCEWVVYAKRPFAGPEAVLAYLSRYTHRVAISNSRLLAMDERGVTFRWKDYGVKDGAKDQTRHKAMTPAREEFMRRFLLHVLPGRFHRNRHYRLIANGSRKASLTLARELLGATKQQPAASNDEGAGIKPPAFVCRHCSRALLIVQPSFTRGQSMRAPPQPGQ